MCPALEAFALWYRFQSKSKYDKWRPAANLLELNTNYIIDEYKVDYCEELAQLVLI